MNYTPTPQLQKWWSDNYAKMRNDSSFTKATIVWNAAMAAASAAAPQVVADERYSSCLATIRDLDRIGMKFAADLAGLPVVEGSRMRNVDYLVRYSVLELVAAWRSAWDENSLQRMPINRAALQAAPVQAQEPFMFGILGPDGKAHIDENCVAGDKDSTALHIEVNCLNDSPDTGYSIVPLYRAPVQPVAVPDSDEAFKVAAQGCIFGNGDVARAAKEWFKAGYKAAPAAQGDAVKRPIPPREQSLPNSGNEPDWKAYAKAEAEAAQGDAKDEVYEFAAKVIELFDDATMRAGHMLDAGECATVIRALKSTEIAAIAAKAAS